MGSTTTPLPVKLKLAMPGNRNAQRNPSLWAMPWPCHGHAMATSCLGEVSRKIWENLVVLSVEKCCRKIPPKKGHGDHSHWRIHCSWIRGAKSQTSKIIHQTKMFGKTMKRPSSMSQYVTLMSHLCHFFVIPSIIPILPVSFRYDPQAFRLAKAVSLNSSGPRDSDLRRFCGVAVIPHGD